MGYSLYAKLFLLLVLLANSISNSFSTFDEDNNGTNTSLIHQTFEDSLIYDAIQIPPIYILNLDRAKERWKSIQSVMSNSNLTIERLPGVDGRQLSKKELKFQSTRLAVFLQPPGVLGCYLSHRKFWQLVVDLGLESAIIFEDDVTLVPNFKDTLQTNLRRLKEDDIAYDIVFLGALGMVQPDGKNSLFANFWSAYVGGRRPYRNVTEYLYQPSRPAVSFTLLLCLTVLRLTHTLSNLPWSSFPLTATPLTSFALALSRSLTDTHTLCLSHSLTLSHTVSHSRMHTWSPTHLPIHRTNFYSKRLCPGPSGGASCSSAGTPLTTCHLTTTRSSGPRNERTCCSASSSVSVCGVRSWDSCVSWKKPSSMDCRPPSTPS